VAGLQDSLPSLEQEDLARPRGGQTADTDIWAEAQPLLIAREHARRLSQGFIDCEDAGFLEVFRFDRRGRSGNILEVLAFADDNHHGAVRFLGQRGGSPHGRRKHCEGGRMYETHEQSRTRRSQVRMSFSKQCECFALSILFQLV
jgi:hypothetical protein